MDDLDHSISIAEYEWMSFYEECEECCLLLPSEASVESSNISDCEGTWSQEYSERCDATMRTAARIDPAVSPAVELCLSSGRPSLAGEHPCTLKLAQIIQMSTSVQADELTAVCEKKGLIHTHVNNPLKTKSSKQDVLTNNGVQKQKNDNIELVNNGFGTNVTFFEHQRFPYNNQFSADKGAPETFSDLPKYFQNDIVGPATIWEDKPITIHKADLDMDERQIHCTYNLEEMICGKDSSVSVMTEKERWFVTVNVSPLPIKRKKKKDTRRKFPPCGSMQTPTLECRSESYTNKSKEMEDGNDFRPSEPLQQYCKAAVAVSSVGIQIVLAETKLIHEDSFPSNSEWCYSQPLTPATRPPYEAVFQSDNLPNSTISKVTLTGQDIPLLDSVKSEDLENGQGLGSETICYSRHTTTMLPDAISMQSEIIQTFAESAEEFSSSNFSHCKSYPSAPDLTEDTCCLFKDHPAENKPEDGEQQSCNDTPLRPTPCDLLEFSETDNVPHKDDVLLSPPEERNEHAAKHLSHDNQTLQDLISLQNHGCKTGANREYTEKCKKPALVCLPVDQSDRLMPQSKSTCDNDTLTVMSQPSDSKPVELCCLITDLFQSPAVCDATACPLPNSPETCAESLGHPCPVFALSAFWDEMEKLTIRDILQLRQSEEQSLHVHDTMVANDDVRDLQIGRSPQSHIVECLWSDAASVNPSRNADSDYSTDLEDSRQDRSSSDFSTFSHLDEENSQLLSSSRETSTDVLNTNLHMQCTAVPPSTRDSMENTPTDDGTSLQQSLEEPHTFNRISVGQTAYVKGIKKSKSMHKIQSLNSTHKDTAFEPILENVNHRAPHINHLSTQKIPFIKGNDSILLDGTLPTFQSNIDILDDNYGTSFPRVWKHLFEEIKTDNDFTTVGSCSFLCDCMRYRNGSQDSLLSIHTSAWRQEKPIPVFTCSRHSAAGIDLTFPEVDHLIHPKAIHVELDVESGHLPICIVSPPPSQGVYPARLSSAADKALFNKKVWRSYWNNWLLFRKIHFHDSDSRWYQRSGPWVFPIGVQRNIFKQAITLSPQRAASFPDQFFRQLEADEQILKCVLSEKEGLFSSLKQSDMCMLCIAIASWVLRSTDPHAADSWKAALLANVSAISAIQYLRHCLLLDPAKDVP